MNDAITAAEAADQARRIIGQVEALQAWCLASDLHAAYSHLAIALDSLTQAHERIESADRLGYQGVIQYDRAPVKPLGER